MKEVVCEERLCTGCGACRQICPQGAIVMSANEEGFLFPRINEDICSDCGLCGSICPVNKGICPGNKDEKTVSELKHKAYACYSADDAIRAKSTSGGVFSHLALQALSDNGVVFGAAFDEEFGVRHVYIENVQELDTLRRSKYVQSDTGETFRQAEAFLKNGRKVIFSGTPCQVAGLKAFLKKDYSNLLACDLACHGVPSPMIWRMYLDYMKNIYKSDIKAISFRDKSTGWNNSSMRIDFKNGSCYMDTVKKEIYFIGFGKSIFNRKSCFNCRFRIYNSKADLTLADFWGIDRYGESEYSDNKGVSLVITHTAAGEEALSKIAGNISIKERSLDEAVKYNPRLVGSVPEPAGRKMFFNDVKAGYDFDMLRKRYMDNKSVKYKVKCIVKRLIGRR